MAQQHVTLLRIAAVSLCLIFAWWVPAHLLYPDAIAPYLFRPAISLFIACVCSCLLLNPQLDHAQLKRIVVGLLAVTMASASLLPLVPRTGLMGSYRLGTDASGKVAESSDFPDIYTKYGATRIDSRIDMGGINHQDGRPPLPIFFYNGEDGPKLSSGRTAHPLHIVWEGTLTPDVSCDLVVRTAKDDALILQVAGNTYDSGIPVQLHAGQKYGLRIEYTASRPRDAWVSMRFVGPSGEMVVPSSWLSSAASNPHALSPAAAMPLGWLLLGSFVALCLCVARPLPRWTGGSLFVTATLVGLAAYLILFLVEGKSLILDRSGSDELTYLGLARHILLTGENPSAPFYFNVLLRYYAAAAQWWMGEGLQSVIALNRVVLGATGILAWSVTRHLSPKSSTLRAGLIAFAAVAFGGTLGWWTQSLKAVVPSAFLMILFCWLCLHAMQRRSVVLYAACGLCLGLNCLMRGNMLLMFGLLPFVLFWQLGAREALRAMALILCFSLLTILPATVHNILGGKFALIGTNSGVLVWLGNNPLATGEYIANMPDHGGEPLRSAIRFVLNNPLHWLYIMFLKVKYIFTSQMGVWTVLFILSTIALARKANASCLLLPAAIVAVPYLTCLITIGSKRYLFPALPLMLCIITLYADTLIDRFVQTRVFARLTKAQPTSPRP